MPDRTVAPPFVKSNSFNLIRPRVERLPNGIEVYLVAGGAQDVLKVELIFPAGRWFEPAPAVAHFTAQMLSKGTEGKNSFEIASIFDQYGAHLEVQPGLDFVSVSVYTLAKNLSPVLALLFEIVSAPVFPEKELAQMQSTFVQTLQINNERTSYVASQSFRKQLFGAAHPYGVVLAAEHVKALQQQMLKQYFQNTFHSPKIFVSGKIDSHSADSVQRVFAKLRTGKTTTFAHTPADGASEGQRIEWKDAVQSSVRAGKKSLLRSSPDYVSVLFATHILGGYFGSRLMKNIREDKGLTYGISASVHALKHDSYFIIGADVNKENVEFTFDEIRKELKRLRTEPVDADELETSRNHFMGSLQAEITTPFAHAEKLKTIALFDLDETYYNDMMSQVERITPAVILEASERYLHEASLIEVAVG